MNALPVSNVLMLAGVLFVIGLAGVLVRKNLIIVLISIEIMLNAAGLAFIAAGARWEQPDGQVMFIFILSFAAAEVSVGLALIMQFFHHRKTLDGDKANSMRG
jgi:NADH-quinone oxidoreductase subunit K